MKLPIPLCNSTLFTAVARSNVYWLTHCQFLSLFACHMDTKCVPINIASPKPRSTEAKAIGTAKGQETVWDVIRYSYCQKGSNELLKFTQNAVQTGRNITDIIMLTCIYITWAVEPVAGIFIKTGTVKASRRVGAVCVWTAASVIHSTFINFCHNTTTCNVDDSTTSVNLCNFACATLSQVRFPTARNRKVLENSN